MAQASKKLAIPGARPKGRVPGKSKRPIVPLTKPLSARMLAFVREYRVDQNASAAARRAGYTAKHVATTAQKLMHNAGIMKLIDQHTELAVAKLELSAELIDRRLMHIAFYDIQADHETKGECWLKAADQIRALELLGKRLNLFSERIEVDVTTLTDAERLQRAQALQDKVKARMVALALAKRAGENGRETSDV